MVILGGNCLAQEKSYLFTSSDLPGCIRFGGGSSEAEKEKVYVFASDATWPPMEYVDENGDIVGFDIDLLAAIADISGFKYRVENTAWDGIFAGLENGSYDAVISAITITREREATMDFTDPYFNVRYLLCLLTIQVVISLWISVGKRWVPSKVQQVISLFRNTSY